MTVLSKPMGPKRALLIAVRHVRCKAGSKLDGLPDLEFVHRDAEEIRDHLMPVRGYEDDDIIPMMDLRSHPEHLWPTRENILRQIDRLVSDAPENCHFFFWFSGHALEVEGRDRASMKAHGRCGEIICADGHPIPDHVLHERLIKPLQDIKGSKLFALFDCCHSETLLDLQRGIGPNRYSRVWKVGAGQLFKDLATVIINLLKLRRKCHLQLYNTPPPPRRASTQWHNPPESKTKQVGELTVICLSACRDSQLAHDDCERKQTFTKCFLDTMAAKPDITWEKLRDELKDLVSVIRTRYEEAWLRGICTSPEPWAQEPRYSTSTCTDLTGPVFFDESVAVTHGTRSLSERS